MCSSDLWGGAVTFRDGRTLFERGLVLDAEADGEHMQGTISDRKSVV